MSQLTTNHATTRTSAQTAEQLVFRLPIDKILLYISFGVFVVIVLFPFYFIFASSFTPTQHLFNSPPAYVPPEVTFENYMNVWNAIPLWVYFRNSVIFTLGSSIAAVLLSALAAYALARIHFPGSNLIYIGMILSVALPQMAVAVPMFRAFNTFHLNNTYQGLIILMSSALLPFTILTLVSFIRQLPVEIEEAAKIDGANAAQVLIQIVFPLIRPAMVTMFIINFIISWNELLIHLIFAPTEATRPLSVALLQLVNTTTTTNMAMVRPWDMMSAMSVIMLIPILLVVLFGQRMIIAHLASGAVK